MAVGAVNFDLLRRNIYWHELPRYQLPAFANRAEISQGAVYIPSLNPLSPTNTAFGTNASNLIGGPEFLSSADILQLIEEEGATSILAQARIEAEEATTTQEAEEVTTTEEVQPRPLEEVQPQQRPEEIEGGGALISLEPTETRPLFGMAAERAQQARQAERGFAAGAGEIPQVSVTGPEATLPLAETAALAAVRTGFGVAVSEQAETTLSELNRVSANNYYSVLNPFYRMDGMIPLSAATLADFSGPYDFNNSMPFKRDSNQEVDRVQDANSKRRYGFIPTET
jgi:hypothetical protein